jgi:hypothetical protein
MHLGLEKPYIFSTSHFSKRRRRRANFAVCSMLCIEHSQDMALNFAHAMYLCITTVFGFPIPSIYCAAVHPQLVMITAARLPQTSPLAAS